MKPGWEVKALGLVSDFQGGGQPPKSEFIYAPRDGYIRMLQIRDFKSEDKAVYIPSTARTNECNADDIMIGRYGASVGQIHRGKAGAYNVALIKTIPDSNLINRDYFYYYLTSDLFQLPLVSVADRSAQAGFSKQDIAPFPIPLPPLDEQKRIVAVLDAAFDGLSRARAHTETNLQNARELFERYVGDMFRSMATDSQIRPLGTIASHSLGKMLDKAKNKGTSRPYLRNVNVRWFTVDTDDVLEMRILESEVERYSVKTGDLLICEGGYPGRASIWESEEPIFFQKALHRVRFANPVYNRLLMYYLYILDASGGIKDYFSGTGIQHFTGAALAKLPFPFPPVAVAVRAVADIEGVMAETNGLQSHYRAKLADLDALRQALLQKAFAGELT